MFTKKRIYIISKHREKALQNISVYSNNKKKSSMSSEGVGTKSQGNLSFYFTVTNTLSQHSKRKKNTEYNWDINCFGIFFK